MGGGIAQRLAHWLPVPAAPGSILGVPNNFLMSLWFNDSKDSVMRA